MIVTHQIPLPRLQEAIRLVVRGFGSEEAEVEAVAGNLIEANLTGHDSHGIGMLPRYAEALLEGGLFANRHMRIAHDAGALVRIDGQSGFGQVIGREAIAFAIERTRSTGCCIAAISRAHHLGRIGAWAEQAAAAGLVSVHFVNVVARNIVAPFGGRDARFGTNPFCAGVPLPGREPVIVDFATSVIAQGKTRVAMNKGETVAPDCLLDDKGEPTVEPRYTVVPPWGALLAFGAHKGSGMAVLCELLGGALAGGLTQRDADASPRRVLNGMLSILIDPVALGGADAAEDFANQALSVVDWVKASPPRDAASPVQVAGEPERIHRARRSAEGVPVDATTWDEILKAAGKLGVDPQSIDRAAGLKSS